MSEASLKKALEEVLKQFNIQLEPVRGSDDLSKQNDYSEIISKTQEKLDELNEKAEDVLKRTGMTREQLDAYANNPNNFTKEQWEALQGLRENVEQFKRQTQGIEKTESELPRKEKKQKHRFGKKKNWIPL
jgi:ABC-type transporter Mla subunit MlaD